MEVEDTRVSKLSRMGNGDAVSNIDRHSGTAMAAHKRQLEESCENRDGRFLSARGGGGGGTVTAVRGLRPWLQYPCTASRIYRVSRASGGKDRHSKVMTAKGLRDRRVRLSVSTAIQFYDLQDRLGYDQPSKAIEWLIKAAAAAIDELPSLDGAFFDQLPLPPGRLQHLNEESPIEAGEDEGEEDHYVSTGLHRYENHHHLQHQEEQDHQDQKIKHHHHPQRLSLTKSTCSSASETSKGSVLSLSRPEIRVMARERARERALVPKNVDIEDDAHVPSKPHYLSVLDPNASASQSSFTELLAVGGLPQHNPAATVAVAQPRSSPNFIFKQSPRKQPTSATTTMDYFTQSQCAQGNNVTAMAMGVVPLNIAGAHSGDHPAEIHQHYTQEHLIPFAVTAAGGDYTNFSFSSSLNRGTLQSNAPSPLLHHLQMFSSPVDGSNLPFFLGGATQAAPASGETQLPAGFDSRLQLCYRHQDPKGKGKN